MKNLTYRINSPYTFIKFPRKIQPTELFHPTRLFGTLKYLKQRGNKVGTQVSICKSCLTLLSKIFSLVRMYRAAGVSKFWWGWCGSFVSSNILLKYFCQKLGVHLQPLYPQSLRPCCGTYDIRMKYILQTDQSLFRRRCVETNQPF